MVATSAPFGCPPIKHRNGGVVRSISNDSWIASAYGTRINLFQPVVLNTNGTLTALTAGATDFFGLFGGCFYYDTNGLPTPSTYWPAGQVIATNTTVKAWVYADPNLMFKIQCDGSLASSSFGDQADFSNFTAQALGTSQCTISSTLVGAGSQGQLRIEGLYEDPYNAWSDAYTIVEVSIARSQFYANKVAI